MTRPRKVNWLRLGVVGVLLFGLAASVAANVLHADPHPVSRIIAGVTPFCLFLALELVTRTPLPGSPIAWVRSGVTVLIGAIAAYVSYWHMVGVAQKYGESGLAPYLLPIAIDGMIVVATITQFELARPAGETPPVPRTAPQVRRGVCQDGGELYPKGTVNAPKVAESAPTPDVPRDRPDQPVTVAGEVRTAAAAVRAAIAEIGDNPEAVKVRAEALLGRPIPKDTVRKSLSRLPATNGNHA